MVGVALSRWSMSYFAVALVSLLTAECLMAGGYGFPATSIAAPQTLVVVHIVAIGWLTLLMCGALFQFVPVLIAKPLYSNVLPLPTLVLLCAGLLALLCGFLQLGGTVEFEVSLLPIGATLLALGFALALWNLGCTLWAARPLALPARFVIVGLASLVAAAGLGIIFAFVLGGITAQARLAALTAAGLPLHVIAALGGWLTITAMGVSYRLLAMFMLAPELEDTSTRGALYLATAAVAVAVVGGVVAICNGAGLGTILSVVGLFALVAFALYGSDMLYLYRARKRRLIELNSRMAAVALVNLAASVILALVLAATGRLAREVGAVVFLVAFGWLSGLGLAQLYKIVAFLTWLECYGPVLGKTQTPRVQDLVIEARASKWFALYFLAVWAGTVILLTGPAWAFQVAAGIMLIATAGIAAQLVRTRRLADVANALRLPQGVHRPRLLLSLSPQT
jgi:hypothetical protein